MKQHTPKYQVLLHQVVGADHPVQYDLTEWLGDSCRIHISKGIREPSGILSLTFLDKPYYLPSEGRNVSLYAMVCPMDVIEVRAARDGKNATKLLMRGYVSEVRREESVASNGKPVRQVRISCHDIGKLWMQNLFYFRYGIEDSVAQLSSYALMFKYFDSTKASISVKDFLAEFATKVFAPALRRLHKNTEHLDAMSVTTWSNVDGSIFVPSVSNISDMPWHAFLSRTFDVGPFNELFLLDLENEIKLICKQNFSQAPGVPMPIITDDAIIAMSSVRSDARVANWFWAWPNGFAQMNNVDVKAQAALMQSESDARKLEWCKEDYFGFRPIDVTFSVRPIQFIQQDNPSDDTATKNKNLVSDWQKEKTSFLRAMNADNSRLEDVTFRVKGVEGIHPGSWMQAKRGNANPTRHYIVRVDHDIQLYGPWVTNLTTERGEGFMDWTNGRTFESELKLTGA